MPLRWRHLRWSCERVCLRQLPRESIRKTTLVLVSAPISSTELHVIVPRLTTWLLKRCDLQFTSGTDVMNKSQVTGSLKDVAGRVQEKAGKLLGRRGCKPREHAIRLREECRKP